MQVQNQQDDNLHQVVTDTVSDLYDGIDGIIEAAKSYVQVETVQDADKLVDYIDSYVKYMHKLIDTIVDNYTSLFQGKETSDSDEASGYRTPSDEEMQNFHNLFEECLQYASNATGKVQKKLASVLNGVQA